MDQVKPIWHFIIIRQAAIYLVDREIEKAYHEIGQKIKPR